MEEDLNHTSVINELLLVCSTLGSIETVEVNTTTNTSSHPDTIDLDGNKQATGKYIHIYMSIYSMIQITYIQTYLCIFMNTINYKLVLSFYTFCIYSNIAILVLPKTYVTKSL